MTIRAALAAGLLGLLASGAAGAASPDEAAARTMISGTVVCRERIALPPDASVHVRLDDASRPELPPRLIAQVTVPTAGRQVPIPFELVYKPADIVASRRYLVRATIVAGGRTLFASKTRYPVLTRGAPTKLEILVEPSGGGAARPDRAAQLEGVEWTLDSLGGVAALDRPEAQARFTLDPKKHGISGSTGCNRFSGRFELAGANLHLDPAGMTMMACAEDVMRREQAFLEALRATIGYRVKGESLELLEADGRVLARFVSAAAAARSH